MVNFEGLLVNVNTLTVLAVASGGAMLGIYFGALNKFKRPTNLIAGVLSFIVIGFSFYLPFAFASSVTNPEADPLRFVGSMVLWVVFTLSATVANILAAEAFTGKFD